MEVFFMLKKVAACLLSIAIMFTMVLQSNQVVFAAEEDPNDTLSGFIESAEKAIQSLEETANENDLAEIQNEVDEEVEFAEAEIVDEDIEKRDRYIKDFLMSDMTHLAIVNPDPVHYLENDE